MFLRIINYWNLSSKKNKISKVRVEVREGILQQPLCQVGNKLREKENKMRIHTSGGNRNKNKLRLSFDNY